MRQQCHGARGFRNGFQPGDFKTTILGERPVIVVRRGEDQVSVVENRCADRGVKFCQARRGHTLDLLCPYHQWNYSLQGDLQGVPFRRGVRKQGGMPPDFDPAQHGLNKLRVEVVHGVVWATFSPDTPPFREYLARPSGSTTPASMTAANWRCSVITGSTYRATGS